MLCQLTTVHCVITVRVWSVVNVECLNVTAAFTTNIKGELQKIRSRPEL